MKTKLAPPTDDPGYAAATKRLSELKADHVQLRAEIAELEEEARNVARKTTSHGERLLDAAKALIRGKDAAPSASAAEGKRRELLSAKYARLPVLEEAIRLQAQDCDDLLLPLSAKACEAVHAEHVAAVRKVIELLTALDRANAAELELRESLEAAGYRVGALRPMPFRAVGQLRDPNARSATYIIEAFEHGFIGIADVPEHLRSWARARVAKPAKASPAPAKTNADGWIGSPA